VKRATAESEKTYADFGCSFETFTNNEFLEIETLGPLTKVAPGQFVDNVERWALFRNVKPEAMTDEQLNRVLLPLVQSVANPK